MQLQWETPGHGGSQLVTAVIHVLFHSTCKHTRPRDVQGPGIPAGPAGTRACARARRTAQSATSGFLICFLICFNFLEQWGWGLGSIACFLSLATHNHSEVPF